MDLPDPRRPSAAGGPQQVADAGTKLRLVLDYLPCEACLAQPVADQELLCTICARLDRQIAVRVGTRTTILVERPSPPEAPVVIPPAPAIIPEPESPREIVVRLASEAREAPPGVIEVVVEPLAPLAALPVARAAPAPVVAAAAEAEPGPEFGFEDILSFTPARDEFFDYKRGKAAVAPPAPREEPAPPPVAFENEPADVPEDDFVFRPPAPEEAPPERREEIVLEDDIIPSEEVPVVPAREEIERWAPPPDLFAEEEPEPRRAPDRVEDEAIQETEIVGEPVPEEEAILDMEIIEDEEPVLEMDLVEEEAAPATGAGDLYRLRGFDVGSESSLAKAGIHEIAHLAGHDAGELAQRTGIAFDRLVAWIQVADLVHEVGVPLDAASALVAAGVGGPRALAEADPDEVVDRVAAFGSYSLNARDVRRWQRRA